LAVRGDLVDEQFERVELAPVDDGHVDGGRAGGRTACRPAEPTAAHDDATPAGIVAYG
jgi:hypothetical protein